MNTIKGKKFKRVIIGNSANGTSFLENFDDVPDNFAKVMNGHIFCTFYDLKKLRDQNYKYFEVVFPFQVSKKLIQNVEKYGMEFRCAGLFFLNKKSYWRKINEFNISHVSSDFI